jgi:large subunit ribosomal protein L18
MKTQRRRRTENKTDYKKRMGLLKSGTPRIVFRKTNKYIISQYVISKEAQDSVKFGITSKELLKYGWPKKFEGSLKSIPASYMTGFLMGKQIIKNKLQSPIIDFGMIRVLHKTKLYAFIKGLIDSGIEIQCKEKAFPEEERISGENLKEDFSKTFKEVKSKIEHA